MLKRLFWIVAAIVLVLPFAAMAQDAEVELPEVDPLSVSGDIIVAGSSTVYPLTEAVAEQFIADGFAGEITIDSIGSGAGFERFCVAGETDISNASRAIRDSEIESCAALTPARTPIEIRVGTDALAVVVSAENDFVESLTIEQLARFTAASSRPGPTSMPPSLRKRSSSSAPALTAARSTIRRGRHRRGSGP